MTTISLRLSRHHAERLKSLARERRTTKAALVRQAIEGLINDAPAGKGESFLDSVRDLAGIIDGPGDLSTNPKRMEGYGK